MCFLLIITQIFILFCVQFWILLCGLLNLADGGTYYKLLKGIANGGDDMKPMDFHRVAAFDEQSMAWEWVSAEFRPFFQAMFENAWSTGQMMSFMGGFMSRMCCGSKPRSGAKFDQFRNVELDLGKIAKLKEDYKATRTETMPEFVSTSDLLHSLFFRLHSQRDNEDKEDLGAALLEHWGTLLRAFSPTRWIGSHGHFRPWWERF